MNDDRYLNVFERIAVALEKIANPPAPVDEELEAQRKDDPNPQITVKVGNHTAVVDGEWIRHEDKLEKVPRPLSGWRFERDDKGLWRGEKEW